MEDRKKESVTEVNANLITKDQYITFRNRIQPDTHLARLLDYLWMFGSITSMECFEELGNTRVGSTVGILRNEYGVPITTTMATKKRNGRVIRYGIYSIERG